MSSAAPSAGSSLQAASATAKATALWPEGKEKASGSASNPPRPGAARLGLGRRMTRFKTATMAVARSPAAAIAPIADRAAAGSTNRSATNCAIQVGVSPSLVNQRMTWTTVGCSRSRTARRADSSASKTRVTAADQRGNADAASLTRAPPFRKSVAPATAWPSSFFPLSWKESESAGLARR
jgi:hypothetical protein